MKKGIKITLYSILTVVSGISLIYLYLYGTMYDIYDFLGRSVPLPFFLVSLYFLIGMVRNNRFEEHNKYGLGMFNWTLGIAFIGVIITAIWDVLSPKIGFTGLATLLIAALGVLVSPAMGVIGIILDKIKR